MTLETLTNSTKPDDSVPNHQSIADNMAQNGGVFHGQYDAERCKEHPEHVTDVKEMEQEHWRN